METMADLLNDASTGTGLLLPLFNRYTCPAKFTNVYAAAANADQAIASSPKLIMSANNWWCSDGSYNLKDSDAYAT